MVSLVPAVPADEDRLWPLHRAAYRDLTVRTWGAWDDDRCRAGFAEDFVVEQVRCLVLEGELIGYVQVVVEPARMFMKSFVVGPSWQGRGLGAQVLTDVMDEARAAGLPLDLSVYEDNAAVRLYERMGFERTAQVEHRVKMRWRASSW